MAQILVTSLRPYWLRTIFPAQYCLSRFLFDAYVTFIKPLSSWVSCSTKLKLILTHWVNIIRNEILSKIPNQNAWQSRYLKKGTYPCFIFPYHQPYWKCYPALACKVNQEYFQGCYSLGRHNWHAAMPGDSVTGKAETLKHNFLLFFPYL